MPQDKWTPPEAGDAPAEVKRILKEAYAAYRDKHPAENQATKRRGAKIAWYTVKQAGYHKNAEDKWVKKKKEMADVTAKDFVIFKAGMWNGETFTENDLDNMVKSCNAEEPIPIIIGHSSDYKGKTLIPAFGRILGGLKRIGQNLVACGVEFNDKLANWIREGFYNQRSIELTRDNKRVLAVGMLGAIPPAVKGLPANDETLNEIALQFSQMEDAKVIEFAEGDAIELTDIDKLEMLAVDDTFKTLTECCGLFLEDIEKMLEDDANPEEVMQEVWGLQADLCEALNLHLQFIKKIEQIDEGQEAEYAEKRPGWKEFVQTIKNLFNKRKETEMDAKEKKEYQDKIDALDAQVKEFQEKERVTNEAKAKTEADARIAEAKVVAETQANEVKTFCDTAIKDNRMTPAMREVDEKIMLDLSKTSLDALKSFQQKYVTAVVPLGVTKEVDVHDKADKRPEIIVKAEKYATGHPKEFSGLTPDQAISRAIYLQSIAAIKFE